MEPRDNVFRIKGRISNIYLINDERIAIIDTGSPNDLPLIISCIKDTLGRSLRDVDLIIPTHSHIEHMGNANKIKKITDARVMLKERSANPLKGSLEYIKKIKNIRKGIRAITAGIKNNPIFLLHPLINIKSIKADVICCDGMELTGHPEWTILFTPGHSPNCISLYHRGSMSLITGDALITIEGKISRPSVIWDSDKYDRTLAKFRKLQVNHIYPGHGEPLSGSDLQKYI